MQSAHHSPEQVNDPGALTAVFGACYSVVAADRSAAARIVRALVDRGGIEATGRDAAGSVRFTLGLDEHERAACVHRAPHLLSDHTLLENWMMCLWRHGDAAGPAARRDMADAVALYSGLVDLPPLAYPAALSELALLAAQFVQAHLVRGRALVLVAVLADWHPRQRAAVAQFIAIYRRRFPFHPLVYVDCDAADPLVFPSQVFDAL